MSSTIAAITTGTGGVITTADNSGNLNLVSGTTTIVAVTSAGAAVTGTLSSTGITTVADGTAALPAIVSTTGTADTGLWFPAADTVAASTAGTERMRIDSSGNVGIGTSSPAYKLDVTGQGRATTGFAVSTDGSTFTPSGLNAIPNYGVGYITSTSQTALCGFGGIPFYTNQAERMRIDMSGNLLVATTSSDLSAVGIRLMNNNQLQTSKSGDWSLRMGRRDSTGIIAEIYYNSSRVGDIATNGTGTTYNTSSDYRLKNTISPMTAALATVALLKPVTFKWNVDSTDGQGFIAHELQAVVPDCVTGEKDAVDAEGKPIHQGIDTSFLVATLTAAIQELKAIIDTQAAQITALNAKVGI